MKPNKQILSRRLFSQGLLSLGASVPLLSHSAFDLSWLGFNNSSNNRERFLSAQGRNSEHYGLGWIEPKEAISKQVLTGFRGHGLCQNPMKPEQVIMFSRRPGLQGIRINTLTGEQDAVFNSAPDRNMQGHGCFSADGKFLYCVESETSTGLGKITIRDGETLMQIGEFESYGIGPHEMALMPDKTTLVIANGGLLTHPDSGRKVLNYSTMRSTLSYVDTRSGELISEHQVPETKASIRHLDVAEDGTVAVALQVQRKAMSNEELRPLAAIHKQGQEIKLLQAPEALLVKLNDYMGSVKVHNPSRTVAFTSPKGNLAMFWHLDNLKLQGYHGFHDVCGLAISQDNKHFVLSNSAGKIRQINAYKLEENIRKRLNFPTKNWDNHMLSVSIPS
ncbi:MAG: DUF1513 domain-containing protein [Oleispira sp.]